MGCEAKVPASPAEVMLGASRRTALLMHQGRPPRILSVRFQTAQPY
jgi:hypothetical protein